MNERVRKYRDRHDELMPTLQKWTQERRGLGLPRPTDNEALEGKGFIIFSEMAYLT